MKKELQEKLYSKYPHLFKQKDLSVKESCMAWGLECDIGWYDLIDKACSKIVEIDIEKRMQFTQIKEKFGTIRMYYCIIQPDDSHEEKYNIDFIDTGERITVGDVSKDNEFLFEKIDKIIGEAEDTSAITCELCGKSGKLQSKHGWLKTICEECVTKDMNDYKPVERK